MHGQSYFYKILHIKGYDNTWNYYNKCKCNETQAFLHRHCVQNKIDVNTDHFKTFTNLSASFSNTFKNNNVNISKWSHTELMKNTRTELKSRYQRAKEALNKGYHASLHIMAGVKAFIKFEKMGQDKIEEGKPARLIQHRSYEYLYLLKSLLGPAADALKKSETKISKTQCIKDIFGVGLPNETLAGRIVETYSKHNDCVVLCLDHSKWDGHYSLEIMKVLHEFWLSIVDAKNKSLLKKLLSLQEINRGKSQCGLKFKTFATRMSGEYTTSVENTLANYFILKSVFPDSSIIACGDDSLVFLDRKIFNELDLSTLSQKFSHFGQDTKLDRIAHEIEQIDFCQCSPVLVDGKYRMVRKVDRLIGRIQYTNYDLNETKLSKYIAGLGLCELANHPGVPIIQELCLTLLNKSGYKSPLRLAIDREGMVSESTAAYKTITMETRASFERAFGITPFEQIMIEKSFGANYSEQAKQFIKKNHEFKNKQDRGL